MSRYVPPVPVPADARDLVQSIVDAENGFWDMLRDLNAGARDGTRTMSGADVDSLCDRGDAKKAACEQLRKKYFPRAARVTVDVWGDVYTWSPTGRVVRKVWSLEQLRSDVV